MNHITKSFPIDELISSIDWKETAELFGYIIGRKLTDGEIAMEKELMRSRINLIFQIETPYLPCKYWALNLKQEQEAEDPRNSGNNLIISFRSIEYHFRIVLRTGNVYIVKEQDDPEFNFLKDILTIESKAEKYEKCAAIKKHLDKLLEGWDHCVYPI